MNVTIKDVAKLAGVSVATVSRVINNKGYVSAETVHKVKDVMKRLKYEPNQVARGLTAKKTKTIALIVPDILNPFFPVLARGVEDVATLHGFTLILCNSDESGIKEKSYIDVLRKKYVDGIIFASNNLSLEDIEGLEKANIPLVVLDRAPNMETNCVIRVDNYSGAIQAVQHLIDVGCKKIAHIYGPLEYNTARERLAGYEDIVKNSPWFTPTLMVPGDFTIDGGKKATEELLRNHPDIDGIFSGNDMMAVGVLKQLHSKNIQVPDQIAVCGFDGINLTEITQPELTTVVQPIYQAGKLAAEKLITRINKQLIENEIINLEVSLVVRDSTRRKVEGEK
ncbi:LacI family transcriptional regulator [Bacillus sp. FJAT-29790]|uniref:LacI family DNA-binding transcriptional regulator n=1 Tax=Bacillus sp. FJAT-29790 TaxID=1895002 RepID=UPI001C24EC55|nr:LacI family transcriptional regulator [Bacillus sp. FJAT-29790]